MSAYYNEIEPYAAQWLRNLIAAGHIAPGEVDERSIADVQADDLRGFTQCHFFAGIGGWSYALRLAGWADNRPVWTGSCPCQPFSAAGKGLGTADSRHLWPEFARLIGECRPAIVFGEQVASKDGREWLAGVRADLEGMAYAVGAADLCAASAAAPHIRQRLWWVGHADRRGSSSGKQASEATRLGRSSVTDGGASRMADVDVERLEVSEAHGVNPNEQPEPVAYRDGLQHPESNRRQQRWPESSQWGAELRCGADGKWRRIEPSIQPLAHGIPNRVGRLRAYGNAIVPEVAAEFIRAVM